MPLLWKKKRNKKVEKNVTPANYKTTVEHFLSPSTPSPNIIAVRHISQSKVRGFGVEIQTKVFLNELVKSE